MSDFSNIVDRVLNQFPYNGQLKSHVIQRCLDEIGTATNQNSYDPLLYHDISIAVNAKYSQIDDFRFFLGLFQPNHQGSLYFTNYHQSTDFNDGDNNFSDMLRSVNTQQSCTDLGTFLFSKGQTNQAANCFKTAVDVYGCSQAVEAAFYLGEMYLFGQGVIQNMAKGFELIHCAGNAGYKPAFFDTGFCQYVGWGCQENSDNAEVWLRKSLYEFNYPVAALTIGGMFLENAIKTFNLEAIINILDWSIARLQEVPFNNSESWRGFGYYILGQLYGDRLQDNQRAITYLLESANLGNEAGQNSLGYLFYHGLGCTRSLENAAYWWKQSSDRGCPEAAYHLGLMHVQKEAPVASDSEGRRLIEIAANSGRIPHAESMFGMMLWHGIGGNEDKVKAQVYIDSAAQKGVPTKL